MTRSSNLVFNTGFTLEEWIRKSKAGELCGILGCFIKPEGKCNHCGKYYCSEHKWIIDVPSHRSKSSH